MASNLLLKGVNTDTTGGEIPMRVLGNRDIPAMITLQIQITGAGKVQIQGRVARDAPWLNIGAPHTESGFAHLVPVQFLRAVSSEMGTSSQVTVWSVWGW